MSTCTALKAAFFNDTISNRIVYISTNTWFNQDISHAKLLKTFKDSHLNTESILTALTPDILGVLAFNKVYQIAISNLTCKDIGCSATTITFTHWHSLFPLIEFKCLFCGSFEDNAKAF